MQRYGIRQRGIRCVPGLVEILKRGLYIHGVMHLQHHGVASSIQDADAAIDDRRHGSLGLVGEHHPMRMRVRQVAHKKAPPPEHVVETAIFATLRYRFLLPLAYART